MNNPDLDKERNIALYANVGPVMIRYSVNVDTVELTKCEAVTLPANVQYAWPHASGCYLYVASSNSASGLGPAGDQHHVSTFAIDPVSGALTRHGEPISLPSRPIHIATDVPSRHILVAFNNPAAILLYRINADATLGDEVEQAGPIEPGIYPHQVRTTLDNRRLILVARGHSAAAGKPEEPGALKVFDYMDGLISREVSIAPNGGYGFGPRHLDFHPTQPWVYVSLERQNALDMFRIDAGGVSTAPVFRKSTLAEPESVHARQLGGAVHVHPNGRFVYVANRASATTAFEGAEVFAGGENSFAVYAIDAATGEPSLIQHVDTRGIHCRTFHIDPSGRLLVAAHIMSLPVRSGTTTRTVPASLSTFRIAADGRLDFVKAYPVDVGDNTMFWMGMVPL